MNRKLNLVLLLGLTLFLAACASNKKNEGPVVNNESEATSQGIEGSDPYGLGLSSSQLEALGITGNPLNYKTVHFPYNSTAISARAEVIIRAHSIEVGRTGAAEVTLSGHADERGTRDYNLALGERRAVAVANLMASHGVGSSKIRTISFGEERPLDTAHNEDAWAKNRRVEIAY